MPLAILSPRSSNYERIKGAMGRGELMRRRGSRGRSSPWVLRAWLGDVALWADGAYILVSGEWERRSIGGR